MLFEEQSLFWKSLSIIWALDNKIYTWLGSWLNMVISRLFSVRALCSMAIKVLHLLLDSGRRFCDTQPSHAKLHISLQASKLSFIAPIIWEDDSRQAGVEQTPIEPEYRRWVAEEEKNCCKGYLTKLDALSCWRIFFLICTSFFQYLP